MKRTIKTAIAVMAMLLTWCNAIAQNSTQARNILDKTAANIMNNKGGASANFSIQSTKAGSLSGTVAIKGNKFYASAAQGKVWNNGKAQWTYTKSTNEVTITNPTNAQQMTVNPYKFIGLYKSGYRLSMTNSKGGYEVHLVAINPSRSIQEAYINITKGYLPTKIRMRQGKNWTNISVTNFKSHNISDATFQFNKKACPGAEIIDLR